MFIEYGDDFVRRIYTSIDLGTDNVKIVVCELFHNKLNLLAVSSTKTKGLKKGLIVDKNELLTSIKTGIAKIEQMLGLSIKKVIAMIPCYDVDYAIGSASKLIDGVVTGDHVNDILQESINGKIPQGKELVTIVPIDFSLDQEDGLKDPKYKSGRLLKTRTIVVSALKKDIYAFISVLEEAGLDVVDISLTTLGDYYSFKNKDNSKAIGAVVNLGYETLTISLYNKGIIFKSSVLTYGSRNIDNDIAYMYNISLDEAQKIKERFAFAHKDQASQSEYYETTNQEGKVIKINQFEVSSVVMSRLEEMLEMARKEINTLTKSQVNYIILTGGTSSMSGFNAICEQVLGRIASVGSIKILGVRNNKYSAAIGNIVYFINKLKLKGRDYTMIGDTEMEDAVTNQKSLLNISSDSMLGKVFGYFFGD